MDVNIRYGDLEQLLNDIEKEKSEIDGYISELKNRKGEMDGLWAGPDAANTFQALSHYFAELDNLSEAYSKFTQNIKTTISIYLDTDNNYSSKMKEVEVNNE